MKKCIIKAMPVPDEYQLVTSGVLAACYGKQAFDTDSLARAVAKRRARGHSYEHYKCAECGKWHIGNHTGYVQSKKKAAKTGVPDVER